MFQMTQIITFYVTFLYVAPEYGQNKTQQTYKCEKLRAKKQC